MPFAPGARLGPHDIVATLGAGGMGEVYRARDTRLDRDVALKVLPASFAADTERLDRFEREARTTGQLNHPNIVSVYDVGTQDGAPYLVTELLEGHTLRERLTDGPVPPRKALEYAVQITRGLAAAHAKGIIHRDLKPENLFLTRDGHLKILDFGLARMAAAEPAGGAASATTLQPTNPGTVLGTVGYMSPEQVRGRPADARSDLFAVGVVLYEMLGGGQPFARSSSAEPMAAILKEDPADLAASGTTIAPASSSYMTQPNDQMSVRAQIQAARLLGTHVGGRADDRTGVAEFERRGGAVGRTRRASLGEAEVEQFQSAVGRDPEVGRLQVAVDDSLVVGGLERVRDLHAERRGLSPCAGSLREPVRERDARHELHDEHAPAIRFEEVVDARDVRVVERGQRTGFPPQPGHARRIAREGLRQDLERHVTAELRVRGPVDLARASLSDALEGPIVRRQAGQGHPCRESSTAGGRSSRSPIRLVPPAAPAGYFALTNRGSISTGTPVSLSSTRCTSGRTTPICLSSVWAPA